MNLSRPRLPSPGRQDRRRIAKPILFRAGAFILSVLFTCLVLEVGLRLFGSLPVNTAPYTPMALSDHEHYPSRKEAGTWRSVVVGDSITRGFGVRYEQIYYKTLEAELNRVRPLSPARRRYEVISIAGNGTSPVDYASALRRLGWQFDPDLVIIGFCLNDFLEDKIDDRMPDHYILLRSIHYWLRSKSHLWFLVGENLRALSFRMRWLREDRMYNHLSYASDTDSDRFRRDWGATKPHLLDIKRMCDERGAVCLLVVFPYDFQLDEAAVRRYQRWGVDCTSAALEGRPQAVLEAFCREVGMPFLDLLPAFRARARQGGEDLFIAKYPRQLDYCHPSVAGHRLAGETIFKALVGHPRLLGTSSVKDP